ncbi:hypothetical protein NPIL_325821 [Nephila pilipes]|uniref:Uncharacterized protein n=1 Tax=Nephila pilipes TaxID=299642 RepID=A0A8X6P434_NEPPI|nr:hypothetical protein NPIL_325821 [Nephila pilipes]
MPKRDVPHIIVTRRSPTTYEVTHPNNQSEVLGQYHISVLRLCKESDFKPMMPIRNRGRPKTVKLAGSLSRTISQNQRGNVTNRMIAYVIWMM